MVSKAYPWSQRPQRGLVSSCGFQIRFYEIVHWHVGRSFVDKGSSGPAWDARGEFRRRWRRQHTCAIAVAQHPLSSHRVEGASAEETRWRAGGVNSQTPSTRGEGRRYSTRMSHDIPTDVPTLRGVAASIGRRPSGRKKLDEPVVPRRGNHRPRAVPHYPFGMLRHGQTMKRLAPQMEDLVRADGPPIHVDGITGRAPFFTTLSVC